MPISDFLFDDPYMKMTGRHLGYLVRRSELLAANIANADTPHYKAKDLEFRHVLAQEIGSQTNTLPMTRTTGRHLGTGDPSLGDAKLVVDGKQTSVDRNTVNMEQEMEKGSETAMMYDVSIAYIKKKGALLDEAIKSQ